MAVAVYGGRRPVREADTRPLSLLVAHVPARRPRHVERRRAAGHLLMGVAHAPYTPVPVYTVRRVHRQTTHYNMHETHIIIIVIIIVVA